MQKVRVGIVQGGPSSEHEVSLETGKAMLAHLPDQYEPVNVFIDRDGSWHMNGDPVSLDTLSQYIDVALLGLHGEYGEDGGVQRDLEQFGIPYTGSGVTASATAFNKHLTKEILERCGIRVAPHVVLTPEEATEQRIQDIFRSQPGPYVVKPVHAGSSVSTYIVDTLPDLTKAIQDVFAQGFEQLMVEQFIKGREATCGVINNFRGEECYALPPVEIIPPQENTFFDYDAKYSGKTEEICPGHFTDEEKRYMEDAARAIHQALGLRHYSRSDFIVSPHGIYALEVNTLPGMTAESLFPRPLKVVGSSFGEFLDHLIKLAHKHA